MYALQMKVLIVFALVVVFVVALALVGAPSHAAEAAGGVTVSVHVAHRIALTVPDEAGAACATYANVDHLTATEWVERAGERVLLITVVPAN